MAPAVFVAGVRLSLPSRERGLKPAASAARAWICRSLPSRERGLKHVSGHLDVFREDVAPFTGAWIETQLFRDQNREANRRSLHGSVD